MSRRRKHQRPGARLFRWMRSDLPDGEEEQSPVLLLGVTKIDDSPSTRRRAFGVTAGLPDPCHERPPATRGHHDDVRLDKIRQDLKFHKTTEHTDPKQCQNREIIKLGKTTENFGAKNDYAKYYNDASVKATENSDSKQRLKSKHNQNKILSRSKKKDKCLVLHCVGACGSCKRDNSFKYSHRGSFLFHRPEDCRHSSLCPSEPYRQCESESSNAPSPDCARGLSLERNSSDILESHNEELSRNQQRNTRFLPEDTSNSRKNLTPKLGDRRYFLLSNLNERFRKTLSLDSKKVDANRTPLVRQQSRPKSMVSAATLNQNSSGDQLAGAGLQSTVAPKKKRFRPKSFFSLDTFFDSRRSDSSSVDDYSSSKYKKFELESDDSPILKNRQGEHSVNREREKTPDLLDLPFINASNKNKSIDPSICKRRLEKLQNHFNQVQSQHCQNTLPIGVSDYNEQGTSGRGPYHQRYNDDEVEYIEPIKSSFTSQSTLTLDSKLGTYGCRAYSPLKPDSILSLNTDDTDIQLEGISTNYTISPKSNSEVKGRAELDSLADYAIEVKDSDVIAEGAKILVVKTMDKSVDSIGSCSLDVDASTDFSDTTSGSLNLLTPSSTTSRVREFTSRIQERAHAGGVRLAPADGVARDRSPKCTPSDTTTQRSHHSRTHHKKPIPESPHKKPSYLNLACSVNGYTHLTTYDSKLRQNINASREASPIRPIAYRPELVVPVPVSADRLLVAYTPNDRRLTAMAAENRQLKSDFLASDQSANMPGRAIIQSKTNDEVDNMAFATKESIFKSSFSETNINNSKRVQSHTYLKTNVVPSKLESRIIASESYTIHNSNGVTKNVEITRDNGEKLTSPMKSFIQQRVERLYGPGALAQGFFNQKRQKNNPQYEESVYTSESTTILTEKSMNHQVSERLFKHKTSTYKEGNTENVFSCERNGDVKGVNSSPALPVLRHLRPEFRAQLPILSPKKSKSPGLVISPKESTQTVPNQSATDIDNSKINTVVESRLNGHNVNVDSVKADDVLQPVVPMTAEALVPILVEAADLNPVIKDGVVEKELCSEFAGGVRLGEGGGEADAVNGGGLYFLELKKRETERLIALSASAEEDIQKLQDKDVSEEVLGLLRSAAGKARLLATQKMQQFEGLCYNNMNGRADERFPTTDEDLRGFWDMVCLQVQNVDTLFQELQMMRENQWQELPSPVKSMTTQGKPSTGSKLKKKTDSGTSCPAKNEKARMAAQKREADRKALLETRRKMAREKQLAARISGPAVGNGEHVAQDSALGTDEEVKIFVSKPVKAAAETSNGTLELVATNGDALTPDQSS